MDHRLHGIKLSDLIASGYRGVRQRVDQTKDLKSKAGE
jgi:hypothetical protein